MIMRQLAEHSRLAMGILRNAGPYVFLELVMPGGTLLALLLFYCRRADSVAIIRRGTQRMLHRVIQACNEIVRTAYAAAARVTRRCADPAA